MSTTTFSPESPVLAYPLNTTNLGEDVSGNSKHLQNSGVSGNFTVPFNPSSPSTEQVTISTGTEDIVVTFDETNDLVTVQGNTYPLGQKIVVAGKSLLVHKL